MSARSWPGYPAVMQALSGHETVLHQTGYFGGDARLLAGRAGGLDVFALDAAAPVWPPGQPLHQAGRAGLAGQSAKVRSALPTPRR